MRLFTALSLEKDAQEKLEAVLRRLRPAAATLKWSPAANLHITTKFIGEWPEERLGELDTALAGVPAVTVPVIISGFGFFPNVHRPRAFFAGVPQADPELESLARRIDEAAAALGIPREDRPYLPHVTLARIGNESVRELQEQIASMTDFAFGSFTAAQFHLYRSLAGVYEILSSYPLRRAA